MTCKAASTSQEVVLTMGVMGGGEVMARGSCAARAPLAFKNGLSHDSAGARDGHANPA